MMALTALGKKLSLSLFVVVRMFLYRLPDGSGTNSLWPGWLGSMAMDLALFMIRLAYIESRSGRGQPTMP